MPTARKSIDRYTTMAEGLRTHGGVLLFPVSTIASLLAVVFPCETPEILRDSLWGLEGGFVISKWKQGRKESQALPLRRLSQTAKIGGNREYSFVSAAPFSLLRRVTFRDKRFLKRSKKTNCKHERPRRRRRRSDRARAVRGLRPPRPASQPGDAPAPWMPEPKEAGGSPWATTGQR